MPRSVLLRVGAAVLLLGTVAGASCVCSKADAPAQARSREGKPIGDPRAFLAGLWTGDGVAEAAAEEPHLVAAIVKLTTLEFAGDRMFVKNLVRPETSFAQTYAVARADDATLHLDVRREGHPATTAKIVVVDDDTIWVRHGTDVAWAVYRRRKAP